MRFFYLRFCFLSRVHFHFAAPGNNQTLAYFFFTFLPFFFSSFIFFLISFTSVLFCCLPRVSFPDLFIYFSPLYLYFFTFQRFIFLCHACFSVPSVFSILISHISASWIPFIYIIPSSFHLLTISAFFIMFVFVCLPPINSSSSLHIDLLFVFYLFLPFNFISTLFLFPSTYQLSSYSFHVDLFFVFYLFLPFRVSFHSDHFFPFSSSTSSFLPHSFHNYFLSFTSRYAFRVHYPSSS